jgi:exonuclease VII small subunit
MPDNRKFRLRPRFKIGLSVIVVTALGLTFYSQEMKLREINATYTQCQSELESLNDQIAIYERMEAYAKTDEYLLNLAKQKLGLLGKNDTKFIEGN